MEQDNNFFEKLKNSKKIPIFLTIGIITTTSIFFIIENNKNKPIAQINKLDKLKISLTFTEKIFNIIFNPK